MIIKREKQVMHTAIAHNLLPNARHPFSNSDWPLLKITPPQFTGHDILWCGISLWSAWVTCSICAASQFLLNTSSLAEHETRKKTTLDLIKSQKKPSKML